MSQSQDAFSGLRWQKRCVVRSSNKPNQQLHNQSNGGLGQDKVTGLMRKACGADTGEITAGNHCGWNNSNHDRILQNCARANRYEFSCKSSLISQRLPRASLLRKCRRSCARTWYNALLSGVTILLDTMSSLPSGVAEILRCIELSAKRTGRPCRIRSIIKVWSRFVVPQLTAVQFVMITDAYAELATEVGEAELDSTSMQKVHGC